MSSNEKIAHESAGRPAHLDPAWRYVPLNEDRKPIMKVEDDPRFWEGAEADWESFQDWVEAEGTIGILPEKSGLVILDCDARREFDVDGNSAKLAVRHGIDDLKRVAAEHGENVVPTFTVKTKSGGFHLYDRQNPQLPVTSKGHRDGWRVDVKASRNSYAVSPPSVGYTVVRDLEAAVLPLWLASWICTVNQSTLPTGGARMAERMERARHAKIDVLAHGSGSSMFEMWCLALLGVVEDAARHGGWNNAIYTTAREFFDVGIDEEHVLDMIMHATPPWDDKGADMIARTVSSAWRGHLDKTGRD